MKKPEKKDEALEVLAADVSQVRWAIGLKTNIGGIKDWQSTIANARDSFAAEHARLKLKQSAVNRPNAETQRKAVSREDLERVREEYMHKMQAEKGWPEGRDHGWKEYALGEDRLPVRITRKTLDARWKEK